MSANESLAPTNGLSGFDNDQTARLNAAGIASLTDLWSRIGESNLHGLDELSKQTGIPREVIIDVLLARVVAEATTREESLLRLYWVHLLIALVLMLVLVLAVRAWVGW
ncbi:MAG: hypothetical protein M3390_10925 [Chloroflexota bacterium]|nr:hypothetical protein [Chloroflexota bacterium]